MSIHTVPQTHREHKAREIAAQPNTVYRVTKDLYLVKSQRTSAYYDIYRTGSAWLCTCPDYRRHRLPCKHIQAVDVLANARDDLDRWTQRRGWSREILVEHIETRMGTGNLDDREILMLQVYRTAAELPTIAFALRYYWPDHHPETLLDPVYGNYQPEPKDIDIRTPARWSTWRPIDGPVESIRDYIEHRSLTTGPIYISESRQHGRWEGRFNLIMLTALAA